MSHPDADADALLPRESLDPYLAESLGITVASVDVLNVGVNVVARIEMGDGDDDSDSLLLRMPNKLRESSLFVDLETEFRVLTALAETDVPTASPVHYCRETAVLGKPFFVRMYLAGDAVSWGAALPERFRDAASRERVAHELLDGLAAIHTVDTDPFEGVCPRSTPRDQVERTLARLDDATSVTDHDRSDLRAVGDWLLENAPASHPTRLVHGDYKPDNVLLGGEATPELVGVLDWETAMLGDPRTELAYFLLYWRDDDDPKPDVSAFDTRGSDEASVEHLRGRIEHGFWPFTNAAGSPTRRKLVARYESVTGITFEHQRFHRALAAFGLATVWEDIDRHAIEAGGVAQNSLHVEYVGWIAERIIDGAFPL